MEIEYQISSENKIFLKSKKNVFAPNTTTDLLIDSVRKKINQPAKFLDLGCGTGAVSVALFYEGLINEKIYASDLCVDATECCETNFERHQCPGEVRNGSMFEPWKNEQFDVIIDDISGIAEEIAAVSPWFPGVPCKSGKDGTDLVSQIIVNSPEYLSKNGFLFFPVLSLSNKRVILEKAYQRFSSVEKLIRKEWPLPKELINHKELIIELQKRELIEFEERFGMILCYTEVYCASQPK